MQQLKWSHRLSSKIAIGIFCVSSAITMAIFHSLEQEQIKVERNYLSDVARDYETKIQTDIERTLSINYAVAALVREYQGKIPNFNAVARDLLPLYPDASALALVSDGEVTDFISLEKNSAQQSINSLDLVEVLGKQPEGIVFPPQKPLLNPEENSKPRLDVFNYLDRKEPNLLGAISYLPIFLQDEQKKDKLWGFTAVTIDFTTIVNNVDLAKLEKEGFAYQLWRIDTETQQKQIIARSSDSVNYNPVKRDIKIVNTNWVLSISPNLGWDRTYDNWENFYFGLFLNLAVAFLAKLLLDSKVSSLEVENIPYFDSLTSLPNYRFLKYRLKQMIAYSKQTEKQIAICYLNLDNFKDIDNRWGYKAGDYILVRIAKRLQKFIRLEDLIARIEGDEFVIVLQELSSQEEVNLILKRIIEAIANPIRIDSEDISVSASIGVAVYPQDQDSIDELISCAKKAMYCAKKQRKGSYILFANLDTVFTQLPSTTV